MAHFTRTQTTSVWTVAGAGNYVTLLSDWQSLADKVFAAWNGDKGGTWAPSSPITINTSGLKVSGPAAVNYGGSLKSTSGARFVLGASDYPKLATGHVGQARTIRQDLLARMSTPRYHWTAAPSYIGSIQTIACTVNGASGLEQPKCVIPLRVHDGSRLTGATLTFRIPTPRAAAPVQMPKVRIVRTDKDGNLVPMLSVAGGGDANGWLSMPKVTSGSAWYAGGVAQTFEIPCDQNNAIDTSAFLYWAQITEEVGAVVVPALGSSDGTVVRERKAIVYHVFKTNTNPAGDPGVGGLIVTGAPVLLVANSFQQLNGIWIVNTGAAAPWVRRADLEAPVHFSPNYLVLDQETWQMWECTTPSTGQNIRVSGPVVDTSATPILFQRRQARGNVYHALACHFDSIVDMRPQ